MIRVMLVDDHAVVRTGFRLLLQAQSDLSVVAEADSGEAACQKYSEITPDVVVMDLAMPGMGGLEALRRIRIYPLASAANPQPIGFVDTTERRNFSSYPLNIVIKHSSPIGRTASATAPAHFTSITRGSRVVDTAAGDSC